MLLKKAKMNRPKFSPVRPPKPTLCNPTHLPEAARCGENSEFTRRQLDFLVQLQSEHINLFGASWLAAFE